MTTAIEVSHLSKHYGGFPAVQDISFTVRPGEVFCLLGPNGAGKTTTTEILEGYRDRTGGEVSVLGHDPGRRERRYRERIGIVLQECGIQDDLTVSEVFDMYRSYAPRPLATADVMAMVDLDARGDERVRNLSGGQRRRLDVGLALVPDPDLIFLDEPTTGFDPAARRQSWAMIRALCGLGKTVLLTTHFMDEAQALADRVAVVAGGRVVASGTPADLGGRGHAPTRIRFTLPVDLPPTGSLADLGDLGGAEVHLDGPVVEIATADGVRVAHRVTGWALDTGVELADLTVTRPTLEDVYLELTTDLSDTRTTEGAA